MWPLNSQLSARVGVCVHAHTSVLRHASHVTAVYNSLIAFTFCLWRASKSAKDETRGPSQVSPGHMPSLEDSDSILDLQEYIGAFQSPI